MAKKNELVPVIPTARKKDDGGPKSPLSFVPDATWRQMLQNAVYATERLQRILVSPQFNRLPVRDQLSAIKLAHDQSFGLAAGNKTTVVIEEGDNEGKSKNELRSLANKALDLPEFSKPPSTYTERRN